MRLLKRYGLENVDEETFNLFFSIPDNCEYSLSDKDGNVVVQIQLMKGQTEPSTEFVPYEEQISGYDHNLEIQFEQQLAIGWEKKPKVKIENCN